MVLQKDARRADEAQLAGGVHVGGHRAHGGVVARDALLDQEGGAVAGLLEALPHAGQLGRVVDEPDLALAGEGDAVVVGADGGLGHERELQAQLGGGGRGLAVGIGQVDDDLTGREHSHLGAQPGEGCLVTDGVEHVDVREGQHVGRLELAPVGGDHGGRGVGVGHEHGAARSSALGQALQQRDRPLRRRSGLLVDDGDVGGPGDRHDGVRGHDRHRSAGDLVKLPRQGVGADVSSKDHGQQVPEAFRHIHPFLAAGTNSSPDGRARRDSPFPAFMRTSRSGHAADPDRCGATSRIRPDSRRTPPRPSGRIAAFR